MQIAPFIELKEHKDIKNLTEALKNNEKVKLDQSEINTVLMNLIHRRRFNYTGGDILEYVARCLCLRKKKLKKYKDKEFWVKNIKKHYLFGKGVDKMNHELDVLTLLRTMRRVKLLS